MLDRLVRCADSDLVLCRKGEKLVYRTSGSADEVRTLLGPYKDLMFRLLQEGECREVREVLVDPRRLSALFWLPRGRELVRVTWKLKGAYERLTVSREKVRESLWRIPEGAVRVHLTDLAGRRVVDVNFAEPMKLAGVSALVGPVAFVVLGDQTLVRAFLASLDAVGRARSARVWMFSGDGV